MWTELSKTQRRLDSPQQSHHVQVLYPPPGNSTEVTQIIGTLCRWMKIYFDDIYCYFAVNLLSFWVIFSPDPLEFVKMMWPQDWPITCQVIKVVHDDGHKQVDDLGRIRNQSETTLTIYRRLNTTCFKPLWTIYWTSHFQMLWMHLFSSSSACQKWNQCLLLGKYWATAKGW